MICKKCGREYEDDMPKCLWCDAPNESLTDSTAANSATAQPELFCDTYKDSPEKLVDIELEQTLTKNIYQGQSAISWTKFMIFINILLFLIEVRTFSIIDAGIKGVKLNVPLPNEFFLALFILIAFLLFTAVPLCMFVGKNWIWIYHAQKIQSKFTETFFSPAGAVFCCYIPVVNYFMFKDLLKSQKETLTFLRIDSKPIPSKTLVGLLIISILMLICNILNYIKNNETFYLFLCSAAWIVFIVFCIKLIKVSTENQRLLQSKLYDNIINHKAEEIIAQRKAE